METLTLEHVYYISQTLAAIAVVFTLAYLVVQIKMSHTIASDANRQLRATGIREFGLTMTTNDQFRYAWIKAEGSKPVHDQIAKELDLNFDEASRVTVGCASLLWMHQAQWASIKSDADIVEMNHLFKGFYGNQPMKTVWKLHPYTQLLDEGFVQFVNNALDKR